MRYLRSTAFTMLLCAVLAPCALRSGQAWLVPETRQLRRPPVRAKYVFGSSHRPAYVVVHSAGETPDSGDNSAETKDTSKDTGFTVGGLGVLLLMGFVVLAVAKHGLGTTLGRVNCEWLGVLAVTAAALKVMRSASSRNRLNGGTIRIISMGFVCAFTGMFCHVGFMTAAYLMKSFAHTSVDMATAYLTAAYLIKFLPWSFDGGSALLLGCVVLVTCVPMITTSYATLQHHGLPTIKLKTHSDKAGISCSSLAMGYAVSALHQVINGAYAILYSGLKTQGLLQCFIVGACFHVCQTAAVVGPERLRSATYRTLNVALVFHSVLRLVAQSHDPLMSAGSMVFPSLALLSSASGWLVGASSK